MNNNFLLTNEHLWDYADGFLSAEENLRVEAYLHQHPEWQERLDALLAEKRAFSSLPLESPQAGFADRVMAAWAAEQVQAHAKSAPKRDWIVYAVTGIFGLLILAPLIVVIATSTSATSLQLPDVQLPNANAIGQALNSSAVQFAGLLGLAFALLLLVDKFLHQRRMLHQLGY